MNLDCYRFQKQVFDNGFLDNAVDATYIIHLEGNGRLDHIHDQLKTYHPTKNIYILFNKGYKKCSKKLYDNIPPVDLVDAFQTVMEHAEEQQYKNILILEDDFIFDEQILDSKHTSRICTFMENNKSKSFIYLLGCLPMIQVPISYYTRYTPICGCTHAVIYTEKCRKIALSKKGNNIRDWDIYTNMNFTQYMYYLPLCYQLFPETENQKHWPHLFGLKDISIYFLNLFGMDKSPQPGFSIIYYISIWLFIIIAFTLLFILFKVFYIKKYYNVKNHILKGFKKNLEHTSLK